MVQDTWTTRKIDKLKKLWDKGLSTSEIGKKLGVSKNAVVGKAHRIGLKSRMSPIKKAKKEVATPVPVVKEEAPKVEKKSRLESLLSSKKSVAKPKSGKKSTLTGVMINDIKPGMCRWPSGDPSGEDFRFCGKPVHKGKSYCLHHCTEAYVIPNQSSEKESSDDEANVERQA